MKEIYKDLVCTITDNNINIENSYKIETRSEMSELLYAIKHNHPECNVFKRKWSSLLSEWIINNRLYSLHIKRKITGNINLHHPITLFKRLIYSIKWQ